MCVVWRVMCGQWVSVGGGLVAASREVSFGAVSYLPAISPPP